MMEQYVEIRAANPDCLLFYRMGDFYELFFDDAVTASRALGIALTKRGKHLGDDIPMCGVPVHAADDYLQKLIALGLPRRGLRADRGSGRGATARLEDGRPARGDAARDAGHDHRGPAARFQPQQLSRRDRAEVAASDGADRHALAWIDISTGEFLMSECPPGGLSAALARIEPREVLIAERTADDAAMRAVLTATGAAMTPLPAAFFDAATAEPRLAELFGVKTMDSFGSFSRAELSAGAGLIAYVEKTQVAKRPPIEPPKRIDDRETMRIDAATRANLELFRSISGSREGTLLAAIDRTRSAGGSRLLAERIASPLADPAGDRPRASTTWRSSSSGPRFGRESATRFPACRTCCERFRGLGSIAADRATST